MSLSRHLQSADFLASLSSCAPDTLRARVLARGEEWFASHEEESRRITVNLQAFGINPDTELIGQIRRHILLHYFEKFLPLCGSPQQLATFLRAHIAVDAGIIDDLRSAMRSGAGVLLAVCHFGAVELISPFLLMHGLSITGVLRFATDDLSRKVERRAQELFQSGLFACARFIEIGKPGVAAAMEMAAVLRRREALLAVFDEETGYSVPVRLLGARVRGGAGLDRILRFVNAPVRVMTAFMVRNDDDTYRLEVCAVSDGSVQTMFDHLQAMVSSHPEQWYFLHEEISFFR